MCGLFGIVAADDRAWKQAGVLADAAKARGNRGFGLVSWSPDRLAVVRCTRPWDGTALTPSPVLLGHLRAPTGGALELQAAHPFETPEFLLAHNGILLNADTTPLPALAYSGTPVDTMALVQGIDQALRTGRDMPTAIAETAAAFDGQQACWLWHKREPALYVWRVMSPILWDAGDAQRFCFGSTATGGVNKLLPPGVVHRVTPDHPHPDRVAAFRFYSPYLETA